MRFRFAGGLFFFVHIEPDAEFPQADIPIPDPLCFPKSDVQRTLWSFRARAVSGDSSFRANS